MTSLPAADNRELQRLAMEAVREAQRHDPFAPVTLLVSSAAQGWELRRQLVAALPTGSAVANLRTLTVLEFLQAYARIARPNAVESDGIVRSIAIERLLATDQGPLQVAAAHKDTAQLLTGLADELSWCRLDPAQLADFALTSTETATAAVSFVRRMRDELQGSAGTPVWTDVVGELTQASVVAFGAHTGPLVIVEQRIPSSARRLIEALAATGLSVHDIRITEPAELAGITMRSCPDPTTEVAIGVRAATKALMAGVSPQAIAILYASDDPYAALLDAELAAAEIEWRGPTADTLGTLVLPRVATLLANMAARRTSTDSGITRKDLMHWFAIGAMTVDSERVPVAGIRKFIRDEGYYGDPVRWLPVLKEFARTVGSEAAQEDSRSLQRARQIEDANRLHRLIERLDAMIARITGARTWTALGESLFAAIEHFHLDPKWQSADENERSALAMLRTLLLTSFPRIDAFGDVRDEAPIARLPQLLERQFLGRRTRHGRSSAGVHVGPIASARGLAFEHVIVLGAAEGYLPPSKAGNPLLPDDAKRLLRATPEDLPTATETATAMETQLRAVLNAAQTTVVTYPRAGVAAIVDGKPSRFFRDHDDDKVNSGLSALMTSGDPVTATDIAVLRALAQTDIPEELQAQVAAARAWQQPEFGAAFGHVPPSTMNGQTLSASVVEVFLHCPYNYFVSRVLRISTDQYPDDVDIISASDFGTLLHSVFEDFVNDATEHELPDYGGSWPEGAHGRLLEILERHVAPARARGVVGWLPAWERQYAMVKESLWQFFLVDDLARASTGLRPERAEQAFGMGDDVSVEVQIDEETSVAFRGFIDRFDVSADRRAVGVIDYKSGNAKPFERSMSVLVAGEREKVQDLVYDAAARVLTPEVEHVEVNFLFFPNDGEPKLVTAPQFDRAGMLKTILQTMQEAARNGVYAPTPTGTRDYCPTCKMLGRRAAQATFEEADDD